MHIPNRFQSPDQEYFLALRLLVTLFVECQGRPPGTVSGCHVLGRWSGARSPHCGADPLPCVRRLSQIFLVPFHLGLVWCNIFLLDFVRFRNSFQEKSKVKMGQVKSVQVKLRQVKSGQVKLGQAK